MLGMCKTFVLDVSAVSFVVSSVADDLDAAVGELNAILASCGFSIMRLRVGKVIARVFVPDRIREGIVFRDLKKAKNQG